MRERSKAQDVSLWAGAAAFFSSLLAVSVFDVLDLQGWYALLSGLIVAGITAGAVYTKQRLDFAKGEQNGPVIPPPEKEEAGV